MDFCSKQTGRFLWISSCPKQPEKVFELLALVPNTGFFFWGGGEGWNMLELTLIGFACLELAGIGFMGVK